jgi:hypothetical protein
MAGIFLFFIAARSVLGPTHSPIQCLSDAISPGIKWQELETDYSFPSTAKVRNVGALPPFPHTPSWHSA